MSRWETGLESFPRTFKVKAPVPLLFFPSSGFFYMNDEREETKTFFDIFFSAQVVDETLRPHRFVKKKLSAIENHSEVSYSAAARAFVVQFIFFIKSSSSGEKENFLDIKRLLWIISRENCGKTHIFPYMKPASRRRTQFLQFKDGQDFLLRSLGNKASVHLPRLLSTGKTARFSSTLLRKIQNGFFRGQTNMNWNKKKLRCAFCCWVHFLLLTLEN